MNSILKHLKGKTAEEILKETNQINSIPIDLNVILETYGIKCMSDTFNDLKTEYTSSELENIAGLILSDEKNLGLFFRESDSVPRRRFIIAYELGHCCLHGDILNAGYIEFRDCPTKWSKIEYEADRFANDLLLSEKQIEHVLRLLYKPSLRIMSLVFKVQASTMRERLTQLEISFCEDIDDYTKHIYSVIDY